MHSIVPLLQVPLLLHQVALLKTLQLFQRGLPRYLHLLALPDVPIPLQHVVLVL